MARFSANPLTWFRKKQGAKASKPSVPPGLLKAPAKPRKSGNLFMHLITVKKSLKAIELAMSQKIDFRRFVKKVIAELTALRLEAETLGEEELAAVTGQVETYFETVSEGRLEVDERGMAVMLEFANIYKEAFGDAVSELSSPDEGRLAAWTACYQAIMAQMKPSLVEFPSRAVQAEDAAPESPEEVAPEPDQESAVLELHDEVPEDWGEKTEPAVQEPPVEEPADAGWDEAVIEERMSSAIETISNLAQAPFEDVAEAMREAASMEPDAEPEEAVPEDEIPLYDPSEELRVRDDIISDAEIMSAREYMEMGRNKPEVTESAQTAEARPSEQPVESREQWRPDHKPEIAEPSPVRWQEVEQLKAKLSELHEKQEALSSKMTDILGDYRRAVETERVTQRPPSIEDLDLEDLENIIFIGREKG